MKKFVIFAMLALFLGSAIGAEKPKREYRYGDKGYFGTARANYIMWNFDSSIPAVSVDIINGYSFNPWFCNRADNGSSPRNSDLRSAHEIPCICICCPLSFAGGRGSSRPWPSDRP